MSSLLFVNDFVGLAETGQALQSLIDVAYHNRICWGFEANIKVFSHNFFSKLGNLSDMSRGSQKPSCFRCLLLSWNIVWQ